MSSLALALALDACFFWAPLTLFAALVVDASPAVFTCFIASATLLSRRRSRSRFDSASAPRRAASSFSQAAVDSRNDGQLFIFSISS